MICNSTRTPYPLYHYDSQAHYLRFKSMEHLARYVRQDDTNKNIYNADGMLVFNTNGKHINRIVDMSIEPILIQFVEKGEAYVVKPFARSEKL